MRYRHPNKSKNLSIRSWAVLNYRFGLANYPVWTLEKIANNLHLTRERIRQIEWMAVRVLFNQKAFYEEKREILNYLKNKPTLPKWEMDFVRRQEKRLL